MPDTEQEEAPSIDCVVFATDFSSWSRHAGAFATLIAKRFHARLLVAHAFLLSEAASEAEAQKVESAERKHIQALLSVEAARFSGIPTLLQGDPREVLPDLANRVETSLMVLGTHGGGWVERGLLGSIAERILRTTAGPSLTAGPQVPNPTGGASAFDRILFVTDFTPEAARAASYAAIFSEAFHATIDVLNIVPREVIESEDKLSAVRDAFCDSLDSHAPRHAREFCHPNTFIEAGSARERILEHIGQRSIGLLVLGLRNRSSLGLQVRTSAAYRLIAEAQCPVLTLVS